MSSTKTIRKVSTSKKEDADPKAIRAELLSEMNSKNQEIKELKETIMQLKVKNSSMNSMNNMTLNMALIRQEMSIADKFIKEIMKSNLPNYQLISEILNEDKEKKSQETKKEEVKAFRDRIEQQSMTYNCNCSTCQENRIWYKRMLPKRDTQFSKTFNLTDRLGMFAHYDGSNLNLEVVNEDSRTKKVVFRRKNNNNSMVTLKLMWRKDQNVDLEGVSFNRHMEVATMMEINGTNQLVSISAELVVKAMRELETNQLEELDKAKVMIENPEASKDCFSNLIRYISEEKVICPMATKMSDLKSEEEMFLLTHYSNVPVYCYIDDGKPTSIKNHISLTEFPNCTKTSFMMMCTPLMRNINFFCSDIEDRDIHDVISMSSEEEESKEKTMEMISSIRNQYNEPFNMMRYKNFGMMIGDFIKTVFMDRNRDTGIPNSILTICSSSKLAINFTERNSFHMDYLLLANMSYKAFLTLAFFCRNLRTLVDLCLIQEPTKMAAMWKIIPMLFIHFFKEGRTPAQISILYNKFLEEITEFKEYNTPEMRKLFWLFKERILNILMMNKIMEEMQYSLNSIYSVPYSKRNFFMDHKADHMNKEIYSSDYEITRFQPSKEENGIKKTVPMEPLVLDISESNEMMEEMVNSIYKTK